MPSTYENSPLYENNAFNFNPLFLKFCPLWITGQYATGQDSQLVKTANHPGRW